MKKTLAIILTMAACLCAAVAEPRPRTPGPVNPGVNTNYGRLNGDVAVYAPKFLNLGNIVGDQAFPYPVWSAHGKERDYRAQNWKPIDWTIEPKTGYVGRLTGKFEPGTNDNIKASVAYDPIPPPPAPAPRVLSKLKAVVALKQAGVWDQVKAWITDNDLEDEYAAAVTFKEDNEYFAIGLASLKQKLGWTDEQTEAFLESIKAD